MARQQQALNSNSDHHNLIKNYLEKIKKEFIELCDEILGLLDNRLVQFAGDDDNESKVLYYKLVVDYNRYLAEIVDNNDSFAQKKAATAYETALEIASETLYSTNPILLSLMLSISVFYADIQGTPGL